MADLPRCTALRDDELEDIPKNRCNKKPTEQRIWAHHTLEFCDQHAELWDDVINWALAGCPDREAA